MVCQSVFIFYLVLRIVSCTKNERFWIVLDIITIGTGCAAFVVINEDLDRYLKATRTLKLLFIIKSFDSLKVPVSSFIKALKKAGKILLPAICFIFFYSVVGLFSFVDY
jgi:hypothetical protein